MGAGSILVNLRCADWRQLKHIYTRDLCRSCFFVRASKPPAIGTRVKVNLCLPSESVITFAGEVSEIVPPGGMDGRGPGVDIKLTEVPQTALWLIETALAAADQRNKGGASVATGAAVAVATRQRKATPTPADQAMTRAASHPGARATETGVHSASPVAEANLDEGRDWRNAEDDLIASLRHELASLRRFNPFQVLGVGYHATIEDVRKAFGVLSKRYHPDRYANYRSQELRDLASELFLCLRDAYGKLSNDAERLKLRGELQARGTGRTAAGQPAATAATAASAASAATKTTESSNTTGNKAPGPFANAEALVEQGQLVQALRIYQLAKRRNPNDRPATIGVELVSGLVALQEGDRMAAADHLETVLDLDPDNPRAASELARMRREQTTERQGALSRLLTKMR